MNVPPSSKADHNQLRQLIGALTEGVILIENDQTIFWANQCALDMHGVHDVAELGGTVSEYRTRFELRYRNHHRLPLGTYPMERVLAGEAFDEVVVEVARAGDAAPSWTHRIRSLALTDKDGVPDCLALILRDETARFDAEERFEATFAANPAPALILRLADLRYIKVNEGFLDLTGMTKDQVLGCSTYDLDVLEGADRRELAIERLREGRTIPQMEASLRLADGASKLVILAGQPIEVGDASCMLFTFADLEPRQQAQSALRQSEERFAKAFRLAPVPMAVASAEPGGPCLTLANDSFLATTGWQEAEVVGRSMAELGFWQSHAIRGDFERALATSGSVRDFSARLRVKDDAVLDCLVSGEAVSINGEPHFLLSFLDVTERRRTEAEVVAAIETVMQDTSWFSRVVMEKLARLRRPDNANAVAEAAVLEHLTPRGRQILALVCKGLDDAAIARQLGLSQTTVRNHVNTLYARTDVHSRTALVVWARDLGFDDAPAGQKPIRRQRRR